MKNRLEKLLRSAGLSQNEARLYFAALNSPNRTLPQLGKLAKVSTATAYRLAESLCFMRLLEMSEDKAKDRKARALPFSNLCKRLDKRIQKLSRISDELNTLLPITQNENIDLDDLASELSPVETFYGRDEFLKWYFRIPEHKDQRMLGFGSIEAAYKPIGLRYECDAEQKWIDKSVKNGLYKTVVFHKTPSSVAMKKNDKKDLRFLKFFDDQPFEKDVWGCVLDDMAIVFFNHEDPKVVVTHHPALLKIYKRAFDDSWEKGSLVL